MYALTCVIIIKAMLFLILFLYPHKPKKRRFSHRTMYCSLKHVEVIVTDSQKGAILQIQDMNEVISITLHFKILCKVTGLNFGI
jgi:hypothetical protein